MKKCAAIVLAAGQGKRMGSSVQKQFMELNGKPVVCYSLECFQKSPFISQIILVTGEESISYCQHEIVEKYGLDKVTDIVAGGKERYDSVYQGLLVCTSDYVFIHDGARPFLTQEILQRGYEGVMESKACVVGMPSKDTVKLADEQGYVRETPQRNRVWMIQTPQIFEYDLIRKAHESVRKKSTANITDDAMIVEQETAIKVRLVEGSYTNIKITTPEDLIIARSFLENMG